MLISPCSARVLPTASDDPRPKTIASQRAWIILRQVTRGLRPDWGGPNTPAHQESHHNPHHPSQESRLQGFSFTPPTTILPYSPTPLGSIKGGFAFVGSGGTVNYAALSSCVALMPPPLLFISDFSFSFSFWLVALACNLLRSVAI